MDGPLYVLMQSSPASDHPNYGDGTVLYDANLEAARAFRSAAVASITRQPSIPHAIAVALARPAWFESGSGCRESPRVCLVNSSGRPTHWVDRLHAIIPCTSRDRPE